MHLSIIYIYKGQNTEHTKLLYSTSLVLALTQMLCGLNDWIVAFQNPAYIKIICLVCAMAFPIMRQSKMKDTLSFRAMEIAGFLFSLKVREK